MGPCRGLAPSCNASSAAAGETPGLLYCLRSLSAHWFFCFAPMQQQKAGARRQKATIEELRLEPSFENLAQDHLQHFSRRNACIHHNARLKFRSSAAQRRMLGLFAIQARVEGLGNTGLVQAGICFPLTAMMGAVGSCLLVQVLTRLLHPFAPCSTGTFAKQRHVWRTDEKGVIFYVPSLCWTGTAGCQDAQNTWLRGTHQMYKTVWQQPRPPETCPVWLAAACMHRGPRASSLPHVFGAGKMNILFVPLA